MPKVKVTLDCGCAIMEDGGRTWCPSCLAGAGLQQAKGQFNQTAIVEEILDERVRQDIKWSEQNHHPFVWLAILGEEKGEADKAALEATYGSDPWTNYRNELIQTAAVALAAIESLDRGKWRRTI